MMSRITRSKSACASTWIASRPPRHFVGSHPLDAQARLDELGDHRMVLDDEHASSAVARSSLSVQFHQSPRYVLAPGREPEKIRSARTVIDGAIARVTDRVRHRTTPVMRVCAHDDCPRCRPHVIPYLSSFRYSVRRLSPSRRAASMRLPPAASSALRI